MTSRSRSRPASTWPSSAPAAWARPPWSACSCSSTGRRKGRSSSTAGRQSNTNCAPCAGASATCRSRRRCSAAPSPTTCATATPRPATKNCEKAARAAGIHDFIASLPLGYQALVGERGVNFSEGQKQRLAIARALVKDPDILVLDEPTSALDSQTEASIFAALPELLRGKTLFIIAHRLSTIRKSDRILCFNDKGLVGVGSHEELREKCAYYQSAAAQPDVL